MKTNWIKRLSCLMMFVLCLSVFTGTVESAIVWSDNFDDEDLTDWTLFGYENDTSTTIIPSNFTAVGGALTVTGDYITVAQHASTINVGTWSFDMFVPSDNHGGIDVMFMSNGSRPFPHFASMFVSVEALMDMGRFDVWEMRGDDGVLFETPYIPSGGIEGWHHIDVSRTNTGRFRVFFNDTLIMDFVSNDVTSSTYLEVFCWNATGAKIDNLEVNDEVLTPPNTSPTTPTTPPDIPYVLIAVGLGAVVVVVLAVVCLRRR